MHVSVERAVFLIDNVKYVVKRPKIWSGFV